jgi:hypothetical protein
MAFLNLWSFKMLALFYFIIKIAISINIFALNQLPPKAFIFAKKTKQYEKHF